MTAMFKYNEDGSVSTDWIPDNGYNNGYSMPYKEFENDDKVDDVTNPSVIKKIISTHNALTSYKDTMYNQNE